MFRPGHISREMIALSADSFRRQYCVDETGAVDFEVIIELDLGVAIEPIDGLRARTNRVGCLSADGMIIYVDADYQRACPKDYMSLLVHEVGHRIHHLGLVPAGGFQSRKEFCLFHDSISEALRITLELEARSFGMHLQMPPTELRRVFSEAVAEAKSTFPSAFNRFARFLVHQRIADHFQVTEQRAEIHVAEEGLWKELKRAESSIRPILTIESGRRA